jgi:microcystin-dependent protein
MGNADADRIADALVDNSKNNTTLGATVGKSTVALVESEMPAHNHAASFSGDRMASHGHVITKPWSHGANGATANRGTWSDGDSGGGSVSVATTNDSAGTPSGTVMVGSKGGGGAHMNMPPSLFITYYVKL